MSAMIVAVLLMKYKYAPPNNRKWREHVSHNAATNEWEYTPAESQKKGARKCQT